jgi:bifunctional enzyme CysN/CysC
VWFTGLSGAGKSTVATTLKALLDELEVPAYQLDGDDLREGLNADLTFSEEDRRENIRRVGEIAILFSKLHLISLVTVISPFAAGRHSVRERHEESGVPFVEVHVATSLAVCEARDPKGLYRRARAGEVTKFTGITSPYEVPVHPDVTLETVGRSPQECATEVLRVLEKARLLEQD